MKTTTCNPSLADASPATPNDPAQLPAASKHYSGTIVAIDPQEHVLCVRHRVGLKRNFLLAENCSYSQLDKNVATVNDLRPGEKVTVRYMDVHGVLLANRIEQEAMCLDGMVKAVDPEHHTLTLHRTALDKQLRFADDCQISLRAGQLGTLADIQPGNHVTVTYETPDHRPLVRAIAQTSVEFNGALTAVDLEERTVKARGMATGKKFHLDDNCAIVINGEPDGRLTDLRLNEELIFSYQEINGVNVVDRIAPAPLTAIMAAAVPSWAPLGQSLGYL